VNHLYPLLNDAPCCSAPDITVAVDSATYTKAAYTAEEVWRLAPSSQRVEGETRIFCATCHRLFKLPDKLLEDGESVW